MKTYLKLHLILFAFACFSSSYAQTFDPCNTLSISGPDSITPFQEGVSYSITGFPPQGYQYIWRTNNNDAVQVVSGQGSTNITLNYLAGDFELTVLIYKDANSPSCCISRTITTIVPKYTIVATACQEQINDPDDEESNCTLNDNQNWRFELKNNENGNIISGATWQQNPTFLSTTDPNMANSLIDNANATGSNSTTMFGTHNDCDGFFVICNYLGVFYFGRFASPGDIFATCNNTYAGTSGYFIGNTFGQYYKVITGSRQALIDSGDIN